VVISATNMGDCSPALRRRVRRTMRVDKSS